MRRLPALAIAALTAVTATGCGSSTEPSPTPSGPVKIAVRIDGAKILTDDARVEVKRGQRVEFDVTATGSGELHVHSDPAQAFYYKPGSSSFTTKALTVPGIIEVEEEDLHKTIVQLAVQ